jgi:hypothetical protein
LRHLTVFLSLHRVISGVASYYTSCDVIGIEILSFLEECMAKPRRRRKIGSKKRRTRWKIRHKIS